MLGTGGHFALASSPPQGCPRAHLSSGGPSTHRRAWPPPCPGQGEAVAELDPEEPCQQLDVLPTPANSQNECRRPAFPDLNSAGEGRSGGLLGCSPPGKWVRTSLFRTAGPAPSAPALLTPRGRLLFLFCPRSARHLLTLLNSAGVLPISPLAEGWGWGGVSSMRAGIRDRVLSFTCLEEQAGHSEGAGKVCVEGRGEGRGFGLW